MDRHPYHMHREQQVAHRRVDKILSGSPAGAKKHAQGDAFSKITSKTAAERSDDKVVGHKGANKYARGGRTKHKGHQTNIAIVTSPHPPAAPAGGPAGAMPGPAGGAPPPMAGPGPLPGGPPGGAPGLPPGGPPPGMPMRARGGRTIDGEDTKADQKKWSARAKANSYFRGGAATGVGREEKAEHAKGRK